VIYITMSGNEIQTFLSTFSTYVHDPILIWKITGDAQHGSPAAMVNIP